MQELFLGRIFADYYQFYISDAKVDLFEKSLDWKADDYARKGYISNGSTVYIGTRAYFNDHWLKVYLDNCEPNFEDFLTQRSAEVNAESRGGIDDCERVLVLNIAIDSGQLLIATPIVDIASIDILIGDYIVYILAYNLGNEEDTDLTDAEFEQRTDFERYVIVLVLGIIQAEGVLKGQQTLW